MSKNIYNKIYSPILNFKIPDFLTLQRSSFENFLKIGLITEFENINQITNSSQTTKIKFHANKYKLSPPIVSTKQSILRRTTYACRLFIPIQIINYKTKQTILKWFFLANLPLMTKSGHFILNGSPKIIMNQIIRSPGIYFQKSVKSEQQVTFSADFIAQRGAWLRLEVDQKKGEIWAKVKRVPKMPIFIFLRCLGLKIPTLNNYLQLHNQKIAFQKLHLKDYNQNQFAKGMDNFLLEPPVFCESKLSSQLNTAQVSETNIDQKSLNYTLFHLLKTSTLSKKDVIDFSYEPNITFLNSQPLFNKLCQVLYADSQDGIIEFEKVAKTFLYRKFLNPRMYNLSMLGRQRINQKLGLDVDKNHTVLTAKDILFACFYLIECVEGIQSPTDIDDLQNRKIKPSGELLQAQFSVGLLRFEKLVRQKLILNEKLKKNILFLEESKIKYLTHFQTQNNRFFNQKVFINCSKKLKNRKSKVKKSKFLIESKKFTKFNQIANINLILDNYLTQKNVSDNNSYLKKYKSSLDKKTFLTSKCLKRIDSLNYLGEKDFLDTDIVLKTCNQNTNETNESKLNLKQNQKLQNLLTAKPINSALREFFGTNPLAQLLDQTNPLSEITHKRRLSCLGPGGISRDTAGMAIRGIHPTHYGRICPIETPEGQNAGLVNSFTIYANLNKNGFIETPFYKTYKGLVLKNKKPFLLSSDQEKFFNLAPGDIETNCLNFLPSGLTIPTRQLKRFKRVSRSEVDFIALTPLQMISIATSLIPFLEHDDGNRALMGSNMQRQAVPTIKPSRPLVGTGLESRVIADVNYGLQTQKSGFVGYVDGQQIIVYSHKSTNSNYNHKNNKITRSSVIHKTNRQKFKSVIRQVSNANLQKLKNHRIKNLFITSECQLKPNTQFIESLGYTNNNHTQLQLFGYKSYKYNLINTVTSVLPRESNITLQHFKRLKSKQLYQLSNLLFENDFLALYKLVNFCSTKNLYCLQNHNYRPILSNRCLILIKQFYNKTVLLNYVNLILKLACVSGTQFFDNSKCSFQTDEIIKLTNTNLFQLDFQPYFSNPLLTSQIKFGLQSVKQKNFIIWNLNNNFSDGSQIRKPTYANRILAHKQAFVIYKKQETKAKYQCLTKNSNFLQLAISNKYKLSFAINKPIIIKPITKNLFFKNNKNFGCNTTLQNNKVHLTTKSYSSKFETNMIKSICKKNIFTLCKQKTNNLNINIIDYKTNNVKKLYQTDFIKTFNFKKVENIWFNSKNQLIVHNNKNKVLPNLKNLNNICYNKLNLKKLFKKYKGSQFKNVASHSFTETGFDYTSIQSNLGFCNIKPICYPLDSFHRSNQDTCLVHRAIIKEGEWVEKGDVLADNAASVQGELSIGQNLLVGYTPWEGYNFEDAVLISDRVISEDLFTTLHIERYEVEIRDTQFGLEQITNKLPNESLKTLEFLDNNGIVKIGTWVHEGDILVGKVAPVKQKKLLPHEKLLYDIIDKQTPKMKDTSLRVPLGVHGRVIHAEVIDMDQTVKFIDNKGLKSKNRLQPKKAQSFSDEQTTQLPTGLISSKNINNQTMVETYGQTNQFISKLKKRIKTNFSTLGLFNSEEHLNQKCKTQFSRGVTKPFHFSRKTALLNKTNAVLKSPLKVHIYLAEKRKIQIGDKIAGRHGNKGIISNILPKQDMPFLPDGTPLDLVLNPLGVPSRMNVGQIFECLLGLAGSYLGQYYKIQPFDELYGCEASRSLVYSKLYEARIKTGQNWLFDPNFPGKTRLFDGRTGECFEQSVTVGKAYILKLVHLVDEKIHARSTGPYSLVTQQPLRGRSKQGGQRVGEMEVWAFEGFGAAYILQELLTIKSDDIKGRNQVMKSILNNEPLTFGTPESFKVLVRELQSLCLDIDIYKIGAKGKPIQIDIRKLP